MRKTLLFDLDGTLLNTLEDLRDSTNFALRTYGYPERSLEEVRRFVGNGLKMLLTRRTAGQLRGRDRARAGVHEGALLRKLSQQDRPLSRHSGAAAAPAAGGLPHGHRLKQGRSGRAAHPHAVF